MASSRGGVAGAAGGSISVSVDNFSRPLAGVLRGLEPKLRVRRSGCSLSQIEPLELVREIRHGNERAVMPPQVLSKIGDEALVKLRKHQHARPAREGLGETKWQ